MKIPAQVRERGTTVWDGNVCINFAVKFLEFLREIITEDGVYGIKFVKGGSKVDVFKKGEKTFLTEEYINWKSK